MNNKKNRIILKIVFILFVFVCISTVIFIIKKPLNGKEIAQKSKSVLTLLIYNDNHDLIATGSGFIAFDNSTLITNYHVIEDCYYVEAVSEDDIHYNVKSCVYASKEDDIAILRFNTPINIPVLTFAKKDSLIVGNTVYAIGSPMGLKNTVSNGIISSYREKEKLIQFTAPISHGSSGGVLLDSEGKILGITSASYVNGQNLNFAIPYTVFYDVTLGKEKSFKKLIDENNIVGNSLENYSQGSDIHFVENDKYLLSNYNDKREIICHDKDSNETFSLNIRGYDLNIYNDCLYYINYDFHSIHRYNIDQKNDAVIIKDLSFCSRFYVTSNGIIVFDLSKRIYCDLSGKIKNRIEEIESIPIGRFCLLDKNNLVYYDNNDIFLYNLEENKSSKLYSYDSEIIEKLFCTSDRKLFFKSGSVLGEIDIKTGKIQYHTISNEESTIPLYIYENKYYYCTNSGTYVYDINTNKVKCILDKYGLDYVAIGSDNIMYAVKGEVQESILKNIEMEENRNNIQYEVYSQKIESKYIKINLKNNDFEITEMDF